MVERDSKQGKGEDAVQLITEPPIRAWVVVGRHAPVCSGGLWEVRVMPGDVYLRDEGHPVESRDALVLRTGRDGGTITVGASCPNGELGRGVATAMNVSLGEIRAADARRATHKADAEAAAAAREANAVELPTDGRRVFCPHCPKHPGYVLGWALADHLRAVHGVEDPCADYRWPELPPRPPRGRPGSVLTYRVPCPDCGKGYRMLGCLRSHVRACAGLPLGGAFEVEYRGGRTVTLSCTACRQRFATGSALRQHLHTAHAIVAQVA